MGFPGGTLLVSTHVFPSPVTPPSITPTSFPNSFPPWTLTFSLSWGRRFCFQHLSLPQAQAHSQAWSHFCLSLFLAASLSLLFALLNSVSALPSSVPRKHHGKGTWLVHCGTPSTTDSVWTKVGAQQTLSQRTRTLSLTDSLVFSLLPLYS